MNISTILSQTLGTLLLIATAFAADIRGTATVEYDPNKKDDNQRALLEAQREAAFTAVEQMMRQQPSSIRQLYEDRKPGIVTTIVEQFTSNVNSSSKINKTMHSCTVTFTATVDDDRVKDALQSSGQSAATVTLDDTPIVLFFTARQVSGVTITDQHASTASATGEQAAAAATESLTDDALATQESRSTQKTAEAISRHTIESDKAHYELDSVLKDEFGTALSDRMLEKGFENMVDGAMFEVSEQLDMRFGAGRSIDASTWKQVTKAVREEDPGIKYMIVGTVDIGSPRTSSMTGLYVTEATIKGDIYDISGSRLPRKIAALAPKTIKGEAADQLQAKKQAMTNLTPLAVDEILAKLKAKNLIKK